MPPGRRRPSTERTLPEPDLVLAGRAWVGDRLHPLEVGLDERGDIVRVGRDLRGARRHDLGEMVLLPSATDLHVHLRDPGPADAAETVATGTLQAALGGVGTVADMPNTEPPVATADTVASKAARIRGRAACDVVLYAVAGPVGAVPALGRVAGAFKLFTSPTTGVELPVPPSEWPTLLRALRATDLPVTVHAELPSRFHGSPEAVDGLGGWDAHRPMAAESSAIDGILRVAGTTRLHFAHVTHRAALDRVREAGFSAEVAPHHLLLSTGFRGPAAAAKVNPPLRPEADRTALWAAFQAGQVPILASDHAPHPDDRKSAVFARAASGIAGVETMLPLMLARVGRGDLRLPVLQAAACERPARWLGLPVGRLLPGHRGHLIAVDFRRRTSIRSRHLHGSGAPSPFEGFEAVFPTEHYLAGERVVDGGEFVGASKGRVVRPEYARR